jgi:putative membrane protein
MSAKPHVSARAPSSVVAGFVGGLAGTWTMGAFEGAWSAVTAAAVGSDRSSTETRRRLKHAGVGAGKYAQSEPRSHRHETTPSETLVDRVAAQVGASRPTPHQRRALGSLVHYAFGACAGAVYGAFADRVRLPGPLKGVLFGILVWLLADEIGIAAVGLAESPRRTPVRHHAYSLGAHIAYGLGLSATSDLLRFARAAVSYRSAKGVVR